jgi:bifunctional non-homologous end joining protein LigD
VPSRPARGKQADEEGGPLADYRRKRDFSATPEPTPEHSPAPKAAGPTDAELPDAELPRFVIHQHNATRLHWDLRLEHQGALASWAIPKCLPQAPGENHLAVATEDHPLEYLDFEAQIPAGQYGAGEISIWDRGTYECLKWEPRKIEVALHGERLRARYALFPIDKDQQPKNWLIHRMDPPADPNRQPMPTKIAPMLARAGSLPRDHQRWAYEIKWDGVRAILYYKPGELRLESRNLNDITHSYPELLRIGAALGSHSAVLDGEIVAFDDAGRPSFAALQQRMHTPSRAKARQQAKDTPVTYVIFDLLWLNGHSLMELRYEQRRELLSAMALTGQSWQTPEHVLGDGAQLLQASARQGLEGIVAKRLDSTYQPELRSSAWLKIKSVGRQELVVGGWMPGKGKRQQSIGALLLGVYDDDRALRYSGRVGSGFTQHELDRLAALLRPLQQAQSPFTAGQPTPKGAVFCQPRLVVEVEFSHWTAAGSLRHPVYKGPRQDKAARQVVREDFSAAPATGNHAPAGEADTGSANTGGGLSLGEHTANTAEVVVDGRELKLSNLAKVLYPQTGFTKRQLIEYYAAIAPVMLGHLAGRALTVKRWPDGVQGKSFFQKHAPAHRPQWVRTATLDSQRSGPIQYTLADDLPTLIWLANLAAIELHTPLALAQAAQRPTAVVFDLDPGPPATVVECCHVAVQLHGMFEGLGLHSFAKTSGSKGLQVYVPLNRADVSYEQTQPFAKAVAQVLENGEPQLVVSRMTKARRTGKVLIDWSQNHVKKTTVCAYSLRAMDRPTVSTPVSWDEVRATRDSHDPASLVFEAGDVLQRVGERGDLFAPVLSLVQGLPAG